LPNGRGADSRLLSREVRSEEAGSGSCLARAIGVRIADGYVTMADGHEDFSSAPGF
jgi:hypothetical protein